MEGFHITPPPPAEIDAWEVKCTGKWTCRPERVGFIAEGGGGMSGGGLVGVAVPEGLEIVYTLSSPLTA
jgi:hypothetical protein